jgi:hypothetical protein
VSENSSEALNILQLTLDTSINTASNFPDNHTVKTASLVDPFQPFLLVLALDK